MNNIWTIVKLNLQLARRKWVFTGITLTLAITGAFIFFASSGDGNPINEIQLRLRYSYGLTYALLTLIVLAMACFTIRNQLDSKNIHMVSAYPVKRWQIWLGNWASVFIIAIHGQIILMSTMLGCVEYYQNYKVKDEFKTATATAISQIRAEVKPLQESIKEKTNARIERLIEEGKIEGDVTDEMWRANYKIARKETIVLPPKAIKKFEFNLAQKPTLGKVVVIRYKILAKSRKEKIKGSWILETQDSTSYFKHDFEVTTYTETYFLIPMTQIPSSGKFTLTLKAQNKAEIVIPEDRGLTLLYQDGFLKDNVIKTSVSQFIHLATATAAGVTAGTALTFPVASFVAIVFYFLSMSAGFFKSTVQDITQNTHDTSLLSQLSVIFIETGMWLSKGLQQPDVIEKFSTSISIPWGETMLQWGFPIILYMIVVAALGMLIMHKKELDKKVN